MAEFSAKITNDYQPDLYGYAIRGQPGNPAMTSFLPIMRGFGRDVIDSDLNPQVNTEEGLAALDMVVTLKNLAPPGVENIGHPRARQAVVHRPGGHVRRRVARPAPEDLHAGPFQSGRQG